MQKINRDLLNTWRTRPSPFEWLSNSNNWWITLRWFSLFVGLGREYWRDLKIFNHFRASEEHYPPNWHNNQHPLDLPQCLETHLWLNILPCKFIINGKMNLSSPATTTTTRAVWLRVKSHEVSSWSLRLASLIHSFNECLCCKITEIHHLEGPLKPKVSTYLYQPTRSIVA